jgi:hypothetical protein
VKLPKHCQPYNCCKDMNSSRNCFFGTNHTIDSTPAALPTSWPSGTFFFGSAAPVRRRFPRPPPLAPSSSSSSAACGQVRFQPPHHEG